MTTTLRDLGRPARTSWNQLEQLGRTNGDEVTDEPARASVRSRGSLPLSVHGPSGVLDLLVPAGASTWDVAREYAERSGLGSVPLIYTRTGALLPPDLVLADGDVQAGTVLVAATSAPRPPRPRRGAARAAAAEEEPGPLAGAWFALAAVAAAVAGWLAAPTGTADLGTPVVVVLLCAAGVGVLPLGSFARLRAVTAPAFAGAAAYALLWDPDPLHLPTILGGAALAAAVTAGVARALAAGADEGLEVWIVAGSVVFVVPALAALVGAGPPLVWSVLLLVAMLAGRFVPLMAVDVPDHHLVDVERLAASAWSARERPRGRRGRTVVSLNGVAEVARHGARVATAASAAIAAVSVLAAPQLLSTVADEIDRIGARTMVFFVGASLLLVARSYRHTGARALLRLAGLSCWVVLARDLLAGLAPDRLALVSAGAGSLAVLVIMAAVATGRGWRSAWWSRRAEVAESLSGAAAIASIVVSSGAFVALWELTSANGPGS